MDKLTPEQFVLLAIQKLPAIEPRNGKAYKGRSIHTVYSQFNAAFRDYFDKACPVEATKQLAAAGKISMLVVRGGAMIAGPGVLPKREQVSPKEALKKMGI